MTLKTYLWAIRIGTLLSVGAFATVLFFVDPEVSGLAGQALFYGSLMLALSGIFILFLTWSRLKLDHDRENMAVVLGTGFRQGILLAILAAIILLLQSYRVLTWWDGLLVVAGVLLVELYFLTRR